MKDVNVIKTVVGRISRQKIVFPFIFLVVAMLFLYNNRYVVYSLFYNLPTASSIADVEDYYDQNKRVINLKVEKLIDIGYEVETITTKDGKETDRNTTSFYCVTAYEDGFILVEMPYSYYKDKNSKYDNIVLKGLLTSPNPSKSYHKEVYDYLTEILASSYEVSEEEVRQAISPVFLNVEELSTSTYVFVYLFIGISIILLILIFKNILSLINYRFSSTYRSLSIYDYPEKVEENILAEYSSQDGVFAKCKNGLILKTYVVSSKVYLTDEIIWAYAKRTKKYDIVIGRSIVLNFINGKTIELTVKSENELNETMHTIASNLPIFIGFYAEYEDLFKNKNRDRFIEALNEYKIEFYSKN